MDYHVKPRQVVQNSCGALTEFCVSDSNAVKLTLHYKTNLENEKVL